MNSQKSVIFFGRHPAAKASPSYQSGDSCHACQRRHRYRSRLHSSRDRALPNAAGARWPKGVARDIINRIGAAQTAAGVQRTLKQLGYAWKVLRLRLLVG
jgi:hypothetical protein